MVADDLTGATDIGAFFSEAGFPTYVFTSTSAAELAFPVLPEHAVAIIDTASRYDDAKAAYQKVYAAFRFLQRAGAARFYKKTCSVFRGNVGAELNAMLDALQVASAVVVTGYPRNRRTMEHGVQFVDGTPLADSHFARDPYQPTGRSNLVEVLRNGTQRSVCLLDKDVISQGPAALRERKTRHVGHCAYLMFDVPNQDALRTVAAAVQDDTVFAGAAGLAGELGPLWNPGGTPCALPESPSIAGLGVLVVSGSLTPVTARQLERLGTEDGALVPVQAAALIDPDRRGAEINRITEEAARLIRAGRNVGIVSPNDSSAVGATRKIAIREGWGDLEAARMISDALGAITAGIMRKTGQTRLVVCGGETASSVCSQLGASGMLVGPSLEPGIPVCDTIGAEPVRLVLKGGSMGAEDLLLRAVQV